jgi:transposase-like protein
VTDKAPEAFRTISEVAEQLDVPQHVLRFWETRFSQIRPMKRGGGRRYYRPEDVDLAQGHPHLAVRRGLYNSRRPENTERNGVAHVVGIGRGEISVEAGDGKAASETRPPAAKPKQPEREVSASENQGRTQTRVVHELTPAQIDELRLALTDLAAARRLLLPAQDS